MGNSSIQSLASIAVIRGVVPDTGKEQRWVSGKLDRSSGLLEIKTVKAKLYDPYRPLGHQFYAMTGISVGDSDFASDDRIKKSLYSPQHRQMMQER